MPEGSASEKRAVHQNRMISVQEASVRKSIGAALFAGVSIILWIQGLANSFPSVLSFLYASALTFALSGIFNQCGCSLRLRWAVSESGRLFKDRVSVPSQHIKFMKGKRQGIVANLLASAAFGTISGSLLYAVNDLLTKPRFTALLYGSAAHIVVMTAASLLT